MDDRARVVTAGCIGAALGGLWGWLYLTASGGAVRSRVGPALDRLTDDIREARATADKARAAVQEARRALNDAGAPREHA
jgi:hypothetical protein